MKETKLKEKALFLSKYASTLWGSGVHTSRVIRNTKRIGEALGIEVKIAGFHKSLILSVIDKQTDERFNVLEEIPHYPISFEINKNLSQLSWEAYDEKLSFDEINERYTLLAAKEKMHPVAVLLLTSFANASFCALFGGDWFSMLIVFSATIIGMFIKQQMLANKQNQFLTFAFCSFIASLVASTSFIFKTTSETALATSVLFLIPGVPLINGFIDIMEGHILTGSARLINAFLLVLSIAIGMSVTILLIKDSL
jgi:uncharacterized membrane protein YjjP (DUF1212 family)